MCHWVEVQVSSRTVDGGVCVGIAGGEGGGDKGCGGEGFVCVCEGGELVELERRKRGKDPV